MGEPGELPSVGLHRVGHDWSDLAATAAAAAGCHVGKEFLKFQNTSINTSLHSSNYDIFNYCLQRKVLLIRPASVYFYKTKSFDYSSFWSLSHLPTVVQLLIGETQHESGKRGTCVQDSFYMPMRQYLWPKQMYFFCFFRSLLWRTCTSHFSEDGSAFFHLQTQDKIDENTLGS